METLYVVYMFLNFRPDETLAAIEDPVVGEVCYVLREWSIIWKKLYMVSLIKKVLCLLKVAQYTFRDLHSWYMLRAAAYPALGLEIKHSKQPLRFAS